MFLQQQDNGNTRAIGGSPGVEHKVKSHQLSPIIAVNLPDMSKQQNKAVPQRFASPAQTSSPPISPIQYTQAPTQYRSPSPVILHPNVTYTRRPSSSPNVSPRASRRAAPRAELRTPPEIEPYPSDSESMSRAHSPVALNWTTAPQSPRYEIRQQSNCAFPIQRSSSTPVSPKASVANAARSSPRLVVVETPSILESCQSAIELTPEIAPSPLRSSGDFLLSSFTSPGSFTPNDLPGHIPGSFSRHVSPRARKSASISGSPSKPPRSTDQDGNSLQSCAYNVPPYPDDHSQCQHTFSHCKHASTYTTGAMQLLSTPRSAGGCLPKTLIDPRSPMTKKNYVPGSVSVTYVFLYILYRRR